jgi:cell division protein FtsI (penicillin-binding protein 3)
MKDGELIEEFPVEVIKEKICNDRALKDMQTILEKVVSIGTGKKAGNKHFPVSGKTGTAQIAMGGNYRGGNMWYLVSFCGYFPSDNPQYTCMVAMRKPGYPASGGTHAGPVFSAIAQKVYSKRLATDISKAKDSTSCPIPDVMAGDMEAAQSVLEEFGINSTSSNPSISWQTAENTGSKINFTPVTTDDNLVPDVTGMGARDAVYALESKGLKVKINGYGKVVRQSIPAGREIQDGQEIAISLDRKPTEKKKTNNEQQNLHNI